MISLIHSCKQYKEVAKKSSPRKNKSKVQEHRIERNKTFSARKESLLKKVIFHFYVFFLYKILDHNKNINHNELTNMI